MKARRLSALAVVFVLVLLHQDVWFWGESQRVLGLPVSLTYHVAFCVACSLAFWALVDWLGLGAGDRGEERPSP